MSSFIIHPSAIPQYEGKRVSIWAEVLEISKDPSKILVACKDPNDTHTFNIQSGTVEIREDIDQNIYEWVGNISGGQFYVTEAVAMFSETADKEATGFDLSQFYKVLDLQKHEQFKAIYQHLSALPVSNEMPHNQQFQHHPPPQQNQQQNQQQYQQQYQQQNYHNQQQNQQQISNFQNVRDIPQSHYQ